MTYFPTQKKILFTARPCQSPHFGCPKLRGYSPLALQGTLTCAHYCRSERPRTIRAPEDPPGVQKPMRTIFQLSGWESESTDRALAPSLATVASGARTLFRAPKSAQNSNLCSFRLFPTQLCSKCILLQTKLALTYFNQVLKHIQGDLAALWYFNESRRTTFYQCCR